MATAINYHHVPMVTRLAQAMQPWLAYTCNPKDTPPGTAAFCRVISYYNLQTAAVSGGDSLGFAADLIKPAKPEPRDHRLILPATRVVEGALLAHLPSL
jgi:hypothetical protein